jgi:uncharacterized phage protein (TIGR02220 family)
VAKQTESIGQSTWQSISSIDKPLTSKPITKEISTDFPVTEIVNYLNASTGKLFRSNSRKTISVIQARISEGFTLDDFKKVIDTKTAKWKYDLKMQDYLRPETLFGTKFESYLNEGSTNGKKQIILGQNGWTP